VAKALHAYTVRHGANARRMVATTSKRAAARLMGVSEYDFRRFGMNAGYDDRELALAQPGKVFERPQISRSIDDWKIVDAKPYEPRRVSAAVLTVKTNVDSDADLREMVERFRNTPRPVFSLIPERTYPVKGAPLMDLAALVQASLPDVPEWNVRAILRVLDQMGSVGIMLPAKPVPRGEMIDIVNRTAIGRVDNDHLYLSFGDALTARLFGVQLVSKKDDDETPR
jgi:hypothetical protein